VSPRSPGPLSFGCALVTQKAPPSAGEMGSVRPIDNAQEAWDSPRMRNYSMLWHRLPMRSAVAATLAVTGAVALAAVMSHPARASSSVAAKPSQACSPPRGPGDNQVHSTNVRAHGISCAEARSVMLRCNNKRLRCQVNSHSWRCRRGGSFGPLGYRVSCSSGYRWVKWAWID
jgi:hypothetical protein